MVSKGRRKVSSIQSLGVMSEEAAQGQVRGLKATRRFRSLKCVREPGIFVGFSQPSLPSWI